MPCLLKRLMYALQLKRWTAPLPTDFVQGNYKSPGHQYSHPFFDRRRCSNGSIVGWVKRMRNPPDTIRDGGFRIRFTHPTTFSAYINARNTSAAWRKKTDSAHDGKQNSNTVIAVALYPATDAVYTNSGVAHNPEIHAKEVAHVGGTNQTPTVPAAGANALCAVAVPHWRKCIFLRGEAPDGA